MELERGFSQRPALPQAVAELGRVGIGGHAGRHALRTFQDVAGAGEALARQIRGSDAVGCRLGGVQLLGIGGVAQELPKTCGLGAGRAQRVQHLFRRQLEQVAGGDCGGQGARRAGGVEDLVV
ncbi:hypothetical protein G6F22_019080 [Rhizopus arrhizus]|nr:hypothetical protein G6F22_019080 [Rhizopus arrhizus]